MTTNLDLLIDIRAAHSWHEQLECCEASTGEGADGVGAGGMIATHGQLVNIRPRVRALIHVSTEFACPVPPTLKTWTHEVEPVDRAPSAQSSNFKQPATPSAQGASGTQRRRQQ